MKIEQAPDIEEYMEVITNYARVGYHRLKKPTPYSVEDMVQEGVMVFYKDAVKGFTIGGPASFKSYLITCLRNHFVDMMKKSFRSSVESNTEYTLRREKTSSSNSPQKVVEQRMMLGGLLDQLTDEEMSYIKSLVATDFDRKETRNRLSISFHVEQRIRRQIHEKADEMQSDAVLTT